MQKALGRNEKYLEVRKLKVVINIDNLESIVSRLEDAEVCPKHLGLEDSAICTRTSCYQCWWNALKEGEIKDE